MGSREESQIRDLGLAPEGHRKIEWAARHMPLLGTLKAQFERQRPFEGLRIGICLHLEAKTAYLAKVVQAGGAEVAVAASNPLSTQDDVVAALVEDGIYAYARCGADEAEYHSHLRALLDRRPDAIIDDGGDLVSTLHRERREQLREIIGGCEETTTGILRLRALEREGALAFPMIAVNDAYCKYLFDNRYGTGQSVWDGIMRTTNLVVAGKTAVVVGYGWCGKGVAMRARGLGARVVVCEVDPIKAIEAIMDGFSVMPLVEAARQADIVVTVTGNRHAVGREAIEAMKDGTLLCNAGHFDVEIDKKALAEGAEVREVRRHVSEYRRPDGRRLYLLAEGRLVNLAAGDGHPVEVMDMTFALQALCLRRVVEEGRRWDPKVYPVPADIDRYVAELRLETMGVKIDRLTEEQRRYLDSWTLQD